MLAHPVALSTLLSACAPNIGPRTMTAIVRVESDGNPLSIHDNSANVSFAPVDLVEALAWSKSLILQHHSIDLGLAQINSANLPRLGMSLREAFDPCTNLRGGATILSSDYRSAVFQFGAGQYALRRAIGAYNTGSLFAGFAYVSKILRAAGIRAEDDFLVPDLASMSHEVDSPVLYPSSPIRPAARRVPTFVPTPAPRRIVHPAVAAAPQPQGAPILVTVGGTNAISPTLVTAPVGSTPRAQAGTHVGPVVLHRSDGPDPTANSPFNSPIGLSRDGLPTSTAPIIAIPSLPATAPSAAPVAAAATVPAPAPATSPVPSTK